MQRRKQFRSQKSLESRESTLMILPLHWELQQPSDSDS
jgi:hypothetical protein